MRAWRESASLIIAAQNRLKSHPSFDYNLFLLKRQSRATFGGTIVFPGGMIEPADADLKWKKLFEHHGYTERNFKSLLPKRSKNRPEIFRKIDDELPREVSLRISAIRETFEECGILMCSNVPKGLKIANVVTSFKLSQREMDMWQTRVHRKADEFYAMCEDLECYPNIWALYEWANWLTPTVFPTSMRFDTAFFFTSLSHVPDVQLENKEIYESMWQTPDFMITSHLTSLLPPQRYEITRISNYKKLDDLLDYAIKHSRDGVRRFVGVRVMLSDGIVHLLPGDSMYPDKVELHEKQLIDMSTMTIKEFRDKSKKTHRIEIPEFKDNMILSKY